MTVETDYLYHAEVINVVDGDTVDVRIDLGFEMYIIERIRLMDVDTAEIYGVDHESEEYKQGIAQKEFVQDWVGSGDVILLSDEYHRGKYGRVIGDLYNPDLGSWLTSELKGEYDL